ncbi:YidB family protein [Rhizobium sp. BK251]|uniref:YidB family protein n=1 Tax=Rhizobium sp. BK251 TaxID=2512125 RepID=UPI0010473480|nr:YidB family protein [Rhizobium sp. BK251]TCL67205.1 uncharacterized protein YidB (DUF937 family) [Rhizobium sp. BK251]
MGILDDAVPGGSISKPLMIALGALLVGKLFGGGGGAPAEQASGQAAPQAGDGGLLGGLGGALGGGLGGAAGGGLGGLLETLTKSGLGEQVDSWVQPGANRSVSPGDLGGALGSQTIGDLARKAGMSEQELLAQLSTILPGVVDKLTPDGRVPDQSQLARLLQI